MTRKRRGRWPRECPVLRTLPDSWFGETYVVATDLEYVGDKWSRKHGADVDFIFVDDLARSSLGGLLPHNFEAVTPAGEEFLAVARANGKRGEGCG